MDEQGTTSLPTEPRTRLRSDARIQLGVAAAVGAVVAVLSRPVVGIDFAVLVGWDVAALTYLALVWWQVHGADAARTRALAVTEYPGRRTAEILVVAAAVVSLVTVVLVLASASHSTGPGKAARALAVVVSVGLSWALVHVVHAVMYARLYYTGGPGGIDFHDDGPPRYLDFAYMAFTVGMTFQVSDTDLTSTDIRAATLLHALISFVFGAVIIATSINFIVTLGG
ncbi:MAG TPA: DUF1345 domain-containing protein [Candidatus Nanopelagicales bacterium]|nr:DUF1345 domain-containing protein [Candidatus Nanopelagicales bacterium]